ncbi:serine/threonine-protein kinase [Paraliomyxa miuraensis]|uniref:serine/threonine-protein kinase n=1 Tax=Paraliomyxa miuraensis TaxID=376150 RepID=UPI0022533C2E|nr:serine/threonine-protein kinase [Paraliomyxa miuraensis]MCX4245991.1 protein kinase [Paraliomyxa miuraensis]
MTIQSHPLELTPGEVLDGKYRVERLLGVGGMGAVYVAERMPLQDKVAIKSILSSQNTEANRVRFLREARAATKIRHPNVVKIFDFGEPPGRPPYMVMEYLAGPTLAAVIRDYAPMPLARALWIFSGLCAAVEAGHRRGVVHRDLKPGNVILSRADDGRETVKVLDFGLAKVLMETEVSALTSPGTMLGTCSYMSPELIEANNASTASDIYALGVILYEMITGRSPFRADNNAATIWRITNGDYERPADLVPDLPQEVSSGIEAALAREPGDRPRSPEELAARVGAPLAASASEHDRPPLELARSRPSPGTEISGSDIPRPDGPASMSLSAPVASDVTTADVSVNLDGGERTSVAQVREGLAFSEVFVGRASDLDALRREYRMTLDGRGRIVVIRGDAGVGKSRLLEMFGDWARSQGALVLRGRFFAYEGDQPPPYETFSWMLTAPPSHSAPRRTHLASGSNSNPGIDPALTQDKWRAFSALTQGFSDRAVGRPLVLTVDDLQWGTALDLEFLAHLPQAIDGPVMVVGTGRMGARNEHHGELDAWLARLGSQRTLSMLRLEGFGIGEVRAWFQACFPGIRIRPQDIRRLQHATSGNPYYLAEVVGQLVQARRIQRNPHGYSCSPLDSVALPDTVYSVVQAKLEGLPEDLRSVLETACVVGEEFGFELLRAATAMEEDALEVLLERAVKLNLLSEDVRSPASDFRFDTTTLRSVLYDGLSRRRRRRLHRTVVDALLRLHGDQKADRISRVLCYHYHAVEDHEETLRWGLRAAEDTLAHYDHDHAELSLRRAAEAAEALSVLGKPVPTHSTIELDRLTGLLYARIGRLEEADAVLQRALELADGHPDDEGVDAQRLDIMLSLAGCQLSRGLLEVSIDLGQMAIELAELLGDRPRELEARLRTARAAAAHGQLDSAALSVEPIIDSAEGPELAPMRVLAMAELAAIHTQQGALERAHDLAQRALTLAGECHDLQAESRATSVLGEVLLEGADLEGAARHLERALEHARSLSLRRREGHELHLLAVCSLQQGNLDEAEARAREALAIFLEIHDLASEGDCRVSLGRILRAAEATEDAIEMLETGRELCATVGRRVYEGQALLELGLISTEDGNLPQAREQLERASTLFGSIDSLHLWRSELGLAKLALAEGDRPRAATHARRAAQLVDIQRSRLGHALDHEAFDRSVSELRETLDSLMS